MPTFAPPYHPSKHHQSLLSRQHKARSRKRKRDDEDSSDDEAVTPPQASASPEPTPRTAASSFHPVNKTDPFYIAGHPRELPLPPPPFPHAAIKDAGPLGLSIDEELASLKPPLYLPTKPVEDQSTSLRLRHLDNMTAILHRCMLRGDWDRAHRAWSLLIRTEVNGRGVDVRRHGRWGIGAELLMRRGAGQGHSEQPRVDHVDQFTDDGFRLARSYYERLILQYPHTQHTQHHLNATAIYPALFNMWIYSAQDAAKRARKALSTQRSASEDSSSTSSSAHRQQLRQILNHELEDATSIATRMDELILGPPYDTDTTLLQLRGMLALWLADLHTQASSSASNDASEFSEVSEDLTDSIAVTGHKLKAGAENRRAREIFSRLVTQGVDLPPSTRQFLEDAEEDE